MIYKINSYYLSNRSKLLIIPTLVVFSIVVFALLNLGIKFSFFAEAVGSSQIEKAHPESYFFPKGPLTNLDSSLSQNQTVESNTASIKIDSDKCLLVESEPPSSFKKLGGIVVYWRSENCTNLTGVGVVYKPDQKVLSEFYSKYLKNNIYLVQNNSDADWLGKLSAYTNTLTASVNLKVKGFTATAKDTYEFEDSTYYLDGVCSLKNLSNCKLWRVNNKSGDFNLIFEGVDQESENLNKTVKDSSYSLRISSLVTQDSKYFNLLLIKNSVSKTWLVTIESSSKSVISIIDLSTQDKVFVSKYLR